jgi:hypothetical protein
MRGEIPSAIGLLVLVGCSSDAAAVAHAMEKVCKNDCDCSSVIMGMSDWNDVDNCKQACEGYATIAQALIEDDPDNGEPCDDLHKILHDLEDCAKGCAETTCFDTQYGRLYDCWPGVFGYAYGYSSSAAEADLPIPGAIPAEQLHAAQPD